MKTIKAKKILLEIIGWATYLLLIFFAVMMSLIALVALITMFTDSFVMGLFGTCGAGYVAYLMWLVIIGK